MPSSPPRSLPTCSARMAKRRCKSSDSIRSRRHSESGNDARARIDRSGLAHRQETASSRAPTLTDAGRLLDQFGDQGGPAGLVAGAKTGAAFAMEVLVEEQVVAPVWIGLKQ